MRFPQQETALPDIMLQKCYPIGCIYQSTVNTNPAQLFGFGTWVLFGVGRVLVGVDAGDPDFDASGKTLGAKTVTLIEAEIPAHTHVQNPHNHTQNAHAHIEQLQGGTTGTNTGTHLMGSAATGGSLRNAGQSSVAVVAVNQAATAVNQNSGGGQAHSNVQPSIAIYRWTRTA